MFLDDDRLCEGSLGQPPDQDRGRAVRFAR